MPEHVYTRRLEDAASQVHPGPTPKQLEVGNFRQGHVSLHGLSITIETAAGSVRTKYNPDGKVKFKRLMRAHYGYIRGTEGKDGDHVDVFIGPHPQSQLVFVIDQLKPDGNLDEHKVILGTTNAAEAKALYLKHYPKDWTGFGGMKAMVMQQFKAWVTSGPRLRKVSALLPDVQLQPHQERIEQEAYEHPLRKLLVHGLGTGKCVRGDTLVLTDRGLLPIASLFTEFAAPTEVEEVFHAENLRVASRVGGAVVWQSVRHLYRQQLPAHEYSLVVRTHRGAEVEVTARHPLCVIRDGELSWVPAAAIQIGDLVAFAAELPAPEAAVSVPASLARLLSWQIAEGHEISHTNTLTITQSDESKLEDCRAWFHQLVPASRSGHIHKQRAAALLAAKPRNPNLEVPLRDIFVELRRLGLARAVGAPRQAKLSCSRQTAQRFAQRLSRLLDGTAQSSARGGTAARWARRTKAIVQANTAVLRRRCAQIYTLLACPLRFECVRAVTRGQTGGLVYDLEVDSEVYDNKNYVGGTGGFILHNTLTSIAASEARGGPVTAVVPAALRPNYRGELKKWTDQTTPTDVVSYSQIARGHPITKLDTLIADEAHRLREPGSKQTQQMFNLAQKAKQVLLLSGSPVVNRPADLAPLMGMLTGKKMDPEEFENRFVGTKKVKPSILQRLRGVTAGEEETLTNPEELKALLKGHVDYYAPDKPVVPVTHQDVDAEMSTEQTRVYRAIWDKLPWVVRWKMRHDFPLNRDELRRMRSFLVGPRQVGLSTLPFLRNKNPLTAFEQSGKLQKAHSMLQDKLQDPRTKALVFSNFIEAGLTPYAAALQRDNVPHGLFHGGLSDVERKKLVDDFNANKLRVALLGPSGAEGLSFKGTQLIQLLDPHFQPTRAGQSVGRGLRFDSHTDLPDDLKNVAVQRFISKLPMGFADRLLGRLGFDRAHVTRGADDYLTEMAQRKEHLNRQFMGLLQDVGQHEKRSDEAPTDAVAALADLVGLVHGESFADLLALPEDLSKDAAGLISMLREAKSFSDRSAWPAKHAILTRLMNDKPHDWFVDSDEGGHVVGITHKPTNFRYHMPRHLVPQNIKRILQTRKAA